MDIESISISPLSLKTADVGSQFARYTQGLDPNRDVYKPETVEDVKSEISNTTSQGHEVLRSKQKPANSPEDLYANWKTDDSADNSRELMRSLDPVIRKTLGRYVPNPDPVSLAKARAMVVEALPRYDGRVSLATYVDRQLQPMQRWGAKKRIGVKIPIRQVQENRKLQSAVAEFEDENGREPSQLELADRTGFSLERIAELRRLAVPVVAERQSGFDEQYSEVGDQAARGDDNFVNLAVYYDLNPVNQFIFEHTIGLNGAKVMSNQEIAKRLRISPGAVSQRKVKIQEQWNRIANE